ncbi:membrane protein insertase YidC, partial [Aliarcobacter butzleri]
VAVNSVHTPNVDTITSKNVSDSQIVSVITTAKNVIEIDNVGRVAQVTLTEEKYKDEKGAQIKLLEVNQLKPLEERFADIN